MAEHVGSHNSAPELRTPLAPDAAMARCADEQIGAFRRVGATIPLAAAALTLVVLVACATIPATGQRRLALMSESQEIELGKEAARQVEQTIGLVEDSALQAYVRHIGGRLAAASERPALPWTFGVVDDPAPNAFALPGGPIYVTRGLIAVLNSEAALASVLAHEIGHITARHAVVAISRQQLTEIGLGLGGILFPAVQRLEPAAGLGLGLLLLKHSRQAEREADELAFRYAGRERYDLREMRGVLAALQRVGELEGRSPLPSWLVTHPAPAERIREVDVMLQAAPPPPDARVGVADYLDQIDRLVYGENPRNGFFRDQTYYHPELQFQFSLPSGWQRQNMARAVTATSPRHDAAVQLTVVTMSVDGAAAQFSDQRKVRTIRSTRESINGLPAVVTLFDAATEEGIIRGHVAHLAHRGLTFRLLTFAAAAAFGAFEASSLRIMRSFAPVTDPEILGVQPRRLVVVRLDREMTLDQFQRGQPSVVPVRILAILNNVADGETRLEAGRLVKRVVQD
jgi:predicted Zn-dependent protease